MSIGPDLYWAITALGDADSVLLEGCPDPCCAGSDAKEATCPTHRWFVFDRDDATRLAIALATALAGKPVPPIEEADGQLELPFPDPPWLR
jgi:hypothetical protein